MVGPVAAAAALLLPPPSALAWPSRDTSVAAAWPSGGWPEGLPGPQPALGGEAEGAAGQQPKGSHGQPQQGGHDTQGRLCLQQADLPAAVGIRNDSTPLPGGDVARQGHPARAQCLCAGDRVRDAQQSHHAQKRQGELRPTHFAPVNEAAFELWAQRQQQQQVWSPAVQAEDGGNDDDDISDDDQQDLAGW